MQIVSALMAAARAAVTATLGERAKLVWPLIEEEARAAARESARELAELLAVPGPLTSPAAPAPRPLPPLRRPLPSLGPSAPLEAPLPGATSVELAPLAPPAAPLAKLRRKPSSDPSDGGRLVAVRRKDKDGTLTTRWVTREMARALEGRETFFESEPEAKPVATREEPAELVEVAVAPEPEPEPEEPKGPTRYETNEDRPPDFLSMRLERLVFRRIPGERYDELVPDTQADPFLRETGFWEVLDRFERSFLLGQLESRRRYDDMRPKAARIYVRIYKKLANWWADLNDDERETFVAKYLDPDLAPPVEVGADPRHEMLDFPLPRGLEPLAERGFKLHDYQKKAANFAIHHAPRALWAMEMGLGKTLTALAAFLALRQAGEVDRLLVLSPVSAHGAWQSHVEDFTRGLRAVYLTGAPASKRHQAYADLEAGKIDVLVASPDTFTACEDPKKAETAAELEKLAEGWTVELNQLGTVSRWRKAAKGKGKKSSTWSAAGVKGLERDTADLFAAGVVTYNPCDAERMRAILEAQGTKILRVADEVQKFKSSDASRTQGFVTAIARPPGRLIGMTGTPKPNRIEDFFHIVNAIKPGALGTSLADFGAKYAYLDEGGQIVTLRPEKLSTLHRDHASVLFSRTTADPDSRINLPPRTDLAPVIPMDATQRQIEEQIKRYMNVLRQARADQARGVEDSWAMRQLQQARAGEFGPIERAAARTAPATSQTALLRWQQLAIDPSVLDPDFANDFPGYESPKVTTIANAAVKHLKERPESAAVLFCEFHKGIDAMRRALVKRGIDPKKIATYDGSVPAKRRRELEKELNTGKISVLLGQTAALETGANLQKRADFVAHLNTPWAPDRLTQSTARVYRQGQQNKVTVLRPVGSPVEALIERVVTRKVRESAQALGKMMVADEQAVRPMDKREKAKLDRASIAAALGIDEELLADQGAELKMGEPEEMEAEMFGGAT